MGPVIQSFLSGFPYLMVHSATTFLIIVIGVRLYMLATPHDEMALVRAGNSAAALSFAGTIFGIALPLAFVLAFSVSVVDIVLWGVVTLVLQLVAFFIVDRLMLKNIPERIERGDMAAAILLVAVKLTTAFVNAAAVSG